MKKFNQMSKKRFDSGPMSIINKELKKAGAPPVNEQAAPSMQSFLTGVKPGRKSKL